MLIFYVHTVTEKSLHTPLYVNFLFTDVYHAEKDAQRIYNHEYLKNQRNMKNLTCGKKVYIHLHTMERMPPSIRSVMVI